MYVCVLLFVLEFVVVLLVEDYSFLHITCVSTQPIEFGFRNGGENVLNILHNTTSAVMIKLKHVIRSFSIEYSSALRRDFDFQTCAT